MWALIKRLGGVGLVCAAVASLVAVGSAAATSSSSCSPPKTAWNFHTMPKLHPMHVHVCRKKASTTPGYIFLGPFKDALYGGKFAGQTGALMLDGKGNPVWFHPAPKNYQDSDFQTATYGASNEPVISFWQGIIAIPPKYTKLPAGAPVKGQFYIYNQKYQQVKTIKAVQSPGKGWITDFHELILTKPTKSHPDGTAIFLAAKKVSANLRKYGGPAKGAYEDEEIQQVDLKTNKLVFHWDVAKHIRLSDSKVHAPKSGVWDAYHANSISLNSAGDMLLSLRNTWGVYNIKPTGSSSFKYVWKLINGKGSSYSLDKSARFYWQHDVRFDGSSAVSMFDDGCCNLGVSPPEHAARGLVLKLSKGHATVARQVHHYNTGEVPTGGNFQLLSSGHAFVGWGQSYYYSEYSKTNSLLQDAAMPKANMSYRTLKEKWTGMPATKPLAKATKPKKGKPTIYASWNGSTTTAYWKVLGGSSSSSQTKSLGLAKRNGFETTIHLSGGAKYYKVEALARNKKTVLGSKVIKG